MKGKRAGGWRRPHGDSIPPRRTRLREGIAMLTRFVLTVLIAATLTAMHAHPGVAQSKGPVAPVPGEISALIAGLGKTASERDSLTVLADSAGGATKDLLEEMIWQRNIEFNAGALDLADKIKTEKSRGGDVTEVMRILSGAIRSQWPPYLAQIKRRQQAFGALSKSADIASGAERLAIESQMSEQSDRLLEAYQSLVEALLALERIGVDMTEQRAYVVRGLRVAAEGMVTRVQLAKRDQRAAGARLSRDGSNAELRYGFEAAEERFKRATKSLSTAIKLMNRLGLETTDLRVALVATTGRITADVFGGKVLLGLLKTLWGQFVDFLVAKAPQWLFQGVVIALTFIGFRALSKLVKRAVRRAVQYSQFSELVRSSIVRVSAGAVMLIGFVVILTQLGVQVAPLMAGLGIAGFAVGFALQSTLSNFAAGGMILGNHPFDVGDEIEVAGVLGIVRRMTLVSTTILTPDNQTIIIPNSTVWGGVIRNRTAQPTRRVDMTFSIDYADDIEKAERALREVVAAHPNVLKEPEPVIKLHQLADSSVNFVVRAWTAKDRYWDVYWDLTRAVKLRFDEEGITIPFPQREVHFASPPPRNPG
jgi:small conductance mechanosensitive channel